MSTTKIISGIAVTAGWTQSNGVWRAEGAAQIAGLTLTGASLELDGNQFTGVVDKLTLDLFDGCNLTSGQTAFGLAGGADILDDVPDAPVNSDESYLYFDAQGGMTLACAGLSLPVSGGSSNRLYMNPQDPSVYFQASDVLTSKSGGSLATSVRKVAGVDIGEATVGMSAEGLIPWRATVSNADGEYETMNANLVLGGDVEVRAGQLRIAVREGSQAYSFNLNSQRLRKAATSGALVVPGFNIPFVGQVDLPLGRGVAAVEGSFIRVSTNLGGSAWEGVGLPDLVVDAIDQLGQSEYDLGGMINVDTGDFQLAIDGSYPFGPWDLEGRLVLNNRGFQVLGETDFKVGPLDFGDLEGTVNIMGNTFWATASGKADLGIAGARLKSDFVMSPGGLGGSASARLWGWKVKGDLEFNGHRFSKATLKTGFDLGPIGGKLKLKIERTKITVRVEGSFAGRKFNVKVNSKGCFRVAGKKFCL